MYKIIGDGVTIYNDISLTESLKAISPKLTLKDNAAGTLEIKLPVGNAGYDLLKRMKSTITVYRNDEELWSGRIVLENIDFLNNRILTCEGELSYLNDTIQPPNEYSTDENTGVLVLNFLKKILEIHNKNVDEEKRFYVDQSYIFNWNEVMPVVCTNYENTLECIENNLLDRYGGHLRIRKQEGKRYLDWFKEEINTNTQVIRFGQNLIDFTKNWDLSELATVIIPRGKQLEKSDISDDIEAYVTVEEATISEEYIPKNDEGKYEITHQGIYVIANFAQETYGWIENIVDFENISEPNELLKEAINYIKDQQFNKMNIEVSAVDLHYFDVDSESIKIGDLIRCISTPHGLNRLFPVMELTIELDKPDSATYILGDTENEISMSSSNAELRTELDKLPSKETMLTLSKANADKLIKETTNGYITIITNEEGGRHSEALVISSEKITGDVHLNYVDNYWIWNINGLAHYNKQNDSDKTELNIAITMDGQINADYITTGTMSADRIRTGILKSEDENVVWNLNEGGSLTIKKGSISLGTSFGNWAGAFCVDDNGVVHAEKGTIGGFIIDNTSIYNDVVSLDIGGLDFKDCYNDIGKSLGNYGTNRWEDRHDIVGLTVDMEYDANYIAWGYRDGPTATEYTAKLMYVSSKSGFGGYEPDSLYIGCNLYLRNYSIKDGWIDSSTVKVDNSIALQDVLLPTAINSTTGTVSSWIKCRIQHGFILGAQ